MQLIKDHNQSTASDMHHTYAEPKEPTPHPRRRWRALSSALFITGYFGLMGGSMAGDSFSKQGNALYKALTEELIKQKICTDYQTCFNATQMHREDGDRIFMNMYAQTDKTLGVIVAKFLIENGMRITNGMPITLCIFPNPKSQYLGVKSIFSKNEAAVKLEINK